VNRTSGFYFFILALGSSAPAQEEPVPNPSFEEGNVTPVGWVLSGGEGQWVQGGHTGNRCVSVTGTGEDSNDWRCPDLALEPGQLYRVSFWAKTSPEASGGTVISGASCANRDYEVGLGWTRQSFVFKTPDAAEGAYLRFGQWHKSGTVYFDDVELTRVTPLYQPVDGLTLGAGETIQEGRYRFQSNFGGEGSNHARPLVSHTAGFNSNRWVMGAEAAVTYRHHVGDFTQQNGRVTVNLGWYAHGKCVVEASPDGHTWTAVGELGGLGTKTFDVPPGLYPTPEIWVRLRSAEAKEAEGHPHPGSFQIYGYTYEAALDGNPPDARGETHYVEVRLASKDLAVEVETLGDLRPGRDDQARLRLSNHAAEDRRVSVQLTLTPEEGEARTFTRAADVAAGQTVPLALPCEVVGVGDFQARLEVTDRQAGTPLYVAATSFHVPSFFAADYGELLPASNEAVAVWWADAARKISRERPAPTERGEAIRISAARHEYEPFQLVLRPARDLSNVTVRVSPLRPAPNFQSPISNLQFPISVCRVAYLHVEHPTDGTGVVGDWPDPLPPVEAPFDVRANENQPLWITVYVPEDAAAGDYDGTITLAAEGWQAAVPLRLHVWDFTLPRETHVQSSFGFSPENVRRYHNLATDEEYRQVVELYLQNFSQHRISPYDPTPFAPIRVDWGITGWTGGSFDREEKFTGAQSLKIVDDSPTAAVAASNDRSFPIHPQATYRLTFAAKTAAPEQSCQVTLNTYDATGAWISGHNVDLNFQGTGHWEEYSQDLQGCFAELARSAQLVLRAVPWTEDGAAMGTTWFDAVSLVEWPGNKNLIEGGDFEETLEDYHVTLDFTDFDVAAAHAFDELHFNSFHLPIHGLGSGTFYSRNYGRIGHFQQGTPEYEKLFHDYVTQLQVHLEEKGWLDKAYIYWFDEPDPKDYEFVIETMDLIQRHAPKLTRMLTEQPEPELYGAVDLWCPVTPNYNFEVAEERRAAGERFWWYICTDPRAPYCTLFIDHPAIELRMWLWQTWKYKVGGILVWASNYWTSPTAFPDDRLQNPWEDPMSYVSGYGNPPGTIAYWGNGDGRFYYPANRNPEDQTTKYLTGPVNSIRWEMLREGIEDYEYFYLLRQLVEQRQAAGDDSAAVREAEALLTVPEEVCVDMTHFTTDSAPLYAHREKLARAVERLGEKGN